MATTAKGAWPEKMHEQISGEHQVQPGLEWKMDTKPVFIRDTYKGSGKLKDKVALITGGDSGIGRSVAVHFAREGADVAILYLPEEDKDAAETEALVQKEGRKCLLLSGDVGSHDVRRASRGQLGDGLGPLAGVIAGALAAVSKVVSDLGKLDILVNNASQQHYHADISEVTEEVLTNSFRTNVCGYFWMAQAALKHMKAGSSIINTTSVTAYRGASKLLVYSATKGAEVAMTRSLANLAVQRGIRVNAVAPGPIWTPLIPATFPKEKIEEWKDEAPMKRPGQPAEVGPSYVFLASEDASFYTGQTLHPDGGTPLNT
ncbi:short-chain dehydrogenase/reductase SDR [Monoraphidium neglectum]|uniref:Short-chain dehydrogenase/reductase SDR n=1 Tax=Monoraphidium neglectum TaxID=145388 RepID=A0A0D2NHB8_9CHLO|nr:short-chain dehydrogenase/reductase SDR [Monoraphidium neglectum]KIZ04411.1 short-chain dehydrogenase/reductase SDR [Monoraphidium neglectum]|eukprot:XP_013903430.1 short-chain dehydrogenase/reductase SDR [Monoraphidium neglectum]